MELAPRLVQVLGFMLMGCLVAVSKCCCRELSLVTCSCKNARDPDCDPISEVIYGTISGERCPRTPRALSHTHAHALDISVSH